MSKNLLYSSGALVIVLIIFGYWLFTASPSESEIENLRQPLTPLPQLNLELLTAPDFQGRNVNGTLPINLEDAGLGREDPFAGN